MIYAPVIIPTLCRFELFKQCLDSLNKNHNAEHTEVYISVDYPSRKEHEQGHAKICEYLDTTKFVFKKMHVYKQTENLGIGNRPGISNMGFLHKIVRSKYDRWIASEDDNLFAANFLDFINEGLEKFKDDKSVLAICGYRFFYNLKFENNNYFRQQSDFIAWGYGIWKDRYDMILSKDVSYLKRVIYNPYKAMKVLNSSITRMANLITLSQKKYFKRGDNFYTQFMIQEGMYEIMPSVSKVRNLGWDNSGLHCNGFNNNINKLHLLQPIDETKSFGEYIGTGFELFDENHKIIVKEDYNKASFLKTLIRYPFRLVCFWK